MTTGENPPESGRTASLAAHDGAGHGAERRANPRFRVVVAREDGEPSSRVLEVEGESLRIGSHPSNHVVLRDRRVSPFHCSLSWNGDCLRVVDHGSQHGTWASGLRARDVEVPPADARIAAGASLLTVSATPGAGGVELHPQSHFGRVVGGSEPMRRLFVALSRAAASTTPLWIAGEPGSGKTLAAEEVVRHGARQGGRMLSLSGRAFAYGSLNAEEAEPAERAEVTAPLDRALALANGGTLLLEHVEELPRLVQRRLLGLLDAQTGRAEGPTLLRTPNVRIIVTSGRSLRRAVNRGSFDEHLYLALSCVANVRLPPLRDRLEDVPLLIQTFLAREHPNARSWHFTSSALAELRSREWPGNVRELFDYVSRALALTSDADVERSRADGADARHASDPSEGPPSVVEVPFKVRKERLIESFEREYLRELMVWASGNVSRAARKARIDRMYLHRLLVRHGIDRGQSPSH